jgi:preprotein translocase SecA subunit
MFNEWLHKIFGSKNDRELKKLQPLVAAISRLEPEFARLSREELKAKTDEFKARLREETSILRSTLAETQVHLMAASGEDREELKAEREKLDQELRRAEAEVLTEILPQAFAAVREAAKRTTGMRHFDVQLLGGVVLHQGKIAEMKTGEGKTLVATLALYLNALAGRGAHLVTVNDYLARRDVQWMGPIYHYLGLSVASIVHDTSFIFDPAYVVKDYRFLSLHPVSRKEAYEADITYGTNNEFGFDYLRDNMKFGLDDYVQRELNFAIVDEVDNILIDEARTPLIISGPAEESTEKYYTLNRVAPRLQKDIDYAIDEKLRSVTLTEEGVAKVERILGVKNLYDPAEIGTLHHVNQALKAHTLFKRDVDYVIKDGEVIIVDEFTGRLMPGRRWSDGLHQAVEAKEGVKIREENQTLATVTIQNYFRMYNKLAGMTGTADTEAVEFKKIYKLDVVVIPPNKPMIRVDHADVVYKTDREKFNAVVEEIEDCHQRGQPVLVGTVSVERSERLSKMLKKSGIKHSVLNAVNHEAEANIIAQAGRLGAVTIATNMAGRGTDILLGGNPEFLARTEIEKEWIGRLSAQPAPGGRVELSSQGSKSYEELLEELREQYNEQVAQARQKYEKELQPFAERRTQALKKLTEIYRPFLEVSCYQARAVYEDMVEQLGNGTVEKRLLKRLGQAKQEYEHALAEYDKVVGPVLSEDQQHEYDTLGAEYAEGLAEGLANEREDGAGRLRGLQLKYEKVLQDYARALFKLAVVQPVENGDVATLYEDSRRAYEEANRLYEETDRLYEEKHRPYEEELARAERTYEEKRRERVKLVEELREQLEKAPDHHQRYDEVLEKYRKICVEEREKVLAAGGLHILGTERHEARRIDNQLRGRSGRQGDPGSSRFYLSLEDDLLRIFGAERIQKIMDRLGMEEGVPIEHGLVSRAIENAQKRVESHNFDIRKHLLEYDDVMNKQREVIYQQRRDVLAGENLKDEVLGMTEELAADIASNFANREVFPEEWDWKGLDDAFFRQFNFRLQLSEEEKQELNPEGLQEMAVQKVRAFYEEKEKAFTPPVMRYLERVVMLQTIDSLWKDHLLAMDHLKEGIGLRGYGQKNPLQEYQREGFDLFEEMTGKNQEDVVQKLFTVQIARQEDVERMEPRRRPQQVMMSHGQPAQKQPVTVRRDGSKVGRNDPCPCGSGKKYKKCHGAG